jgi:hypothetical protein
MKAMDSTIFDEDACWAGASRCRLTISGSQEQASASRSVVSKGARADRLPAARDGGQHTHPAGSSTAARTLSLASSRNAITCSLDTVGNPSRKSLMDSPASRYSMSVWTGTLVPRKTGVPPIIPGSETTTEMLILIFSRPNWAFRMTTAPSSAVTYRNFAANQAPHPTAAHAGCLESGGCANLRCFAQPCQARGG